MKIKKRIPTLLGIVFITILWQLIALLTGYPDIFPSIPNLIKQVFYLFGSTDFLITVSSTIIRGLVGFVFAFSFALVIAIISAFSTFWKSFFHPIIVITRSIPVISFVLLAILWFSPTELPIFIALLTMFPILYQNILTGLEQTDNRWVEMAQVFGKSSYKQFILMALF